MPNAKDLTEWQDIVIDDLSGGMTLGGDTEVLKNNEFLNLENMVYREGLLRRDTGYRVLFDSVVIGDPRRHIVYKKRDGTLVELLITNSLVMRNAGDSWRFPAAPVSADTTVNANEAGGATAIDVVDSTGFLNTNTISIELDDGSFFTTTINGAPAGNVITIAAPLPSAASIGNEVIKPSAYLNGTIDQHVTAVPVPWGDYLVFTNGVDNLKYYDPATDTVADVPGIPTNMKCQTLALYDNSIVVGNTIESGVSYPYRVRYCAKGDLTDWTTLEAGFTDLLDTESHIQQLLKLGPFLMVYRDKSISRIAISGSALRRFDFDTAVNDVGTFSAYGAVDLVDRHIVWTHDDIVSYVGGSGVESLESPIYKQLLGPNGELSEANGSKTFTYHLKKQKEILFFYPTADGTTGCDKALRYSATDHIWMTRIFTDSITGFGARVSSDDLDWSELTGDWVDQNNPWSGYSISGSIEQATFGRDENDVLVYDYVTATDDGNDIPCVIETKDFAHPSYLMRHDYTDFFVRGGNITIEYSKDKGDSWNALKSISAEAKTRRFRASTQFTHRHFRFRLTSSSAMVLSAIHIHYKPEYEH